MKTKKTKISEQLLRVAEENGVKAKENKHGGIDIYLPKLVYRNGSRVWDEDIIKCKDLIELRNALGFNDDLGQYV